jgi:protocatechuate 3,4-dioxygenase beta subunit
MAVACAIAAGTYGVASLVGEVDAAHAAEIAVTAPSGGVLNTNLTCDDLYLVSSSHTYRLDVSGASPTVTGLYRSSHDMDTMALGPAPVERGGDGLLHAYHWAYGTAPSAGRSVLDVAAGATVGNTFTVPRPNSSAGQGWSGGEANQLTGEIYFSGFEDTYLSGNYRLMKYDPVDPAHPLVQSGPLVPNTPSDELSGQSAGRVASDMAVDAEGNVYLLVGSGSTKWLMRVVPGVAGNWRYSKVVQLTGAGGGTSPFSSNDVWGMAFYNGTLYAFGGSTGNLFAIDPISGVARSLGDIPGTGYLDLATCQTAPVIRGVVYDDTDGDGSVSEAEGVVTGATVEMYNAAGAKVGERQTDGAGQYSFILNAVNTDFTVRLVQPQVNGRNAGQTWASADAGHPNTVTADCEAGGAPSADRTEPGPCRGARLDGIDPTSGVEGNLDRAGIRTTVHMTTSSEVAVASFGVTTASSWGDAPDSFGTIPASNGPHHLTGPVRARVWLGETAAAPNDAAPSAAADSHLGDDGVSVRIAGVDVPLSGAVLASGNTYDLRARVSGDSTARAWLRAWLAPQTAAGGPATAWPDVHAFDAQVAGGDTFGSTWTLPEVLPAGPTAQVYARYRVSTKQGAGSTDPASTIPAPGSTQADTLAWVNDGEVEDYRAYVASSVVRLAMRTEQYAAGPFVFTLSNVRGTAPSSVSTALTTTAPDQTVQSDATHIVTAVGEPVTITRTSAPAGWGISEVACRDQGGDSVAHGDADATTVTLPGTLTAAGQDITCVLTFAKAPVGDASEVTATTGTRVADGSEYHEVTALIRSDDNRVLAGQTVTFSLGSATGATLAAPTCLTGADGTCSIRVTATEADTYEVSATVIGPNGTPEALSGSPVSVEFVPGTPDPGMSRVFITPGSKIANGEDYHTVRVELRDANGNRVRDAGDRITHDPTPSDGVGFGTVTALTGDDVGDYTFPVTSTRSGDTVIDVGFTGLASLIGTVTAVFDADDPLPGNSSLRVEPARLLVGETAVATARLLDANQNPVSGIRVCFSTVPEISADITTCKDTSTSGLASVDITTLLARGYEVYASYVDRQNVTRPLNGSPATVVFEPLDPDEGTTTLTGTDAETRKTGGEAYHEATVTVRDVHGNPVPGAPVLFALEPGIGTLTADSSLSGVTVSDGTYTIKVVSASTAGTAYVTALFGRPQGTADTAVTGGAAQPTRLALEFVADTVEPDESEFELSTGTRTANGTDSHTVTVTLRDANRTLVTGEEGHIEAVPSGTGGIGNGSVGPWTEISTGVYRASITSTVWGIKRVEVSWAGEAIAATDPPGTTTIEFVPGPISDPDSFFSVSTGDVVADGDADHYHTVTVTLRDADDNPITDLGTSVIEASATLPGADPPVIAPVSGFTPSGSPGVYTAHVTSTVAGDFTVTAGVRTGDVVRPIRSGTNNTVAHFIAGDPGGLSELTVDRTSARVREIITATATLVDGEGNPVRPTVVTFWTDPPIALAGNGEVTTGEGTGQARITITTTRAGDYQVYAAYGTPPVDVPRSPIAITFTPGNPVFGEGLTELTGSDGTRLADGVDYHIATVTVRDGDANPIPGAAVEVSVGGVGALASGQSPSGLADAGGQYTVRIVSPAFLAGTSTVHATVNGETLTDGQSTDPVVLRQSFINPDIGDGSTYTLTTGTKVANGAEAHTLVVTLLSGTGTPITDQEDELSALARGRGDQGDADVGDFTEGPAGVYTASITSHATGIKDVTVRVHTTTAVRPLTPPGRTTVEFTPDRYDPDHSGYSVSQFVDVLADGAPEHAQTVTVILGDAWNNPISHRDGDLDAEARLVGDSSIEATVAGFRETSTAGTYEAAITSTVAGTFTVTVTLSTGDPSPEAVPAQGNTLAVFVPGPPHEGTSTLVVSETDLVAGETTVATVTARDANSNLKANVEFHLWTDESMPGGGEWWVTTGTAGTAIQQISTTSIGTYRLHAAIGSSTTDITGSPVDITFRPRDVDPGESTFAVSQRPDVIADGVQTQTVTITLEDEYGNPVSPLPGTITVHAAGGGAVATPTPAVPGANPGEYLVDLTAEISGTYIVDVTYTPVNGTAQVIDHGTNNNLAVFVPGPPDTRESILTVTSGEVVVGSNHYATVTVKDGNGNLVEGTSVRFWTVPAIAIADGGIATSGGNGQARVALTTSDAGTYTVYASIGGVEVTASGELTVTFVPGGTSAAESELTIPTEVAATPVVANGTDVHRAQVHVRDGARNDKSGVIASVTVTGPDGGVQHFITPATGANGIAFIEFNGTVAGVYTVTATVAVDGVPTEVTGSPARATMVPGPPSTQTSTLASSREFVEANGTDAARLTVTLADSHGNLLGHGGDQVTFLTTVGGVGPVTDHGDGTYTADATSSSAGSATVSFTVNGTTSTGPAPRTQVIEFIATPATPAPRYANATTVVGTAQPGTTITVYGPSRAEICQTGTTILGTFRCTPLSPVQPDLAVLTVTATESHGFVSAPATVRVDAVPPVPPVVNPTDGTEVTGEGGDPGDTVVVIDPDDGTVLCETEVDADGTFRCGPLTPRPGDGTPIDVIVIDPADNPSEPTRTVVDSAAPEPPDVDPSDGSVVYGDAEPGSHVVVSDSDGSVACEADADGEDGSWSCEPSRDVDDGEELEAVAVDPAGNISRQTVVVADQSGLPAPSVDPSNGGVITGHGMPGYTVVVTFPGGAEVRTVVGADGRWSVTPPPGYSPAHGHELQVTHEIQFNRAQVKTSPRSALVLDRVAPDRARPTPTGGGTLSGKGEPGAAVRVVAANGIELATGSVDATGSWTVTLPTMVVVGDIVAITLTDAAGNVSEAFSLRIGLIAVIGDREIVTVGETVTFTVANLQPAEQSAGTVHSIPVPLGAVAGDINGGATYTWTVPVDAELGVHTFHVSGDFSGEAVSPAFTVLGPPQVVPEAEPIPEVTPAPEVTPQPAPLAKTGISALGSAMLWWTMAALAAGFVLILVAGKRRRREE